MIIAIDGTAAAGKSTLARRIAQAYGLPHLDTGSLYRAVARDVLLAGRTLDDVEAAAGAARRLDPATLSDPGLRLRGKGEAAPSSRRILRCAKRFSCFSAASPPGRAGAVVEGRDIGTVVCPQADAKFSSARQRRAAQAAGTENLWAMVLKPRKRLCCAKSRNATGATASAQFRL